MVNHDIFLAMVLYKARAKISPNMEGFSSKYFFVVARLVQTAPLCTRLYESTLICSKINEPEQLSQIS